MCAFACLYPVPLLPPSATNLVFSHELVYLFVFEVEFTYNTMLVPVAEHRDLMFLYILKTITTMSSYHLSPYSDYAMSLHGDVVARLNCYRILGLLFSDREMDPGWGRWPALPPPAAEPLVFLSRPGPCGAAALTRCGCS